MSTYFQTLYQVKNKQKRAVNDAKRQAAYHTRASPCLNAVIRPYSNACYCIVQVQAIQEAAANLIVAYSGEKAREIQNHEIEVVIAWRNLQIRVDGRRGQLADNSDLYRFWTMVRDLCNWMNDLTRQMSSTDKPR